MTPPTLHTDRLILRPHRATDFEACLGLWSDPETVRHIGGQVQSLRAVWFRMLRYSGMWSLRGFGYWLFEDRETGRYMGEGGLSDSRRGIALLDDVPEIGWALTRDIAGLGFATEAAKAVCRWADEVLNAPITRCIIEPENMASIRVARKLGYEGIATIEQNGTALIVMERRRA